MTLLCLIVGFGRMYPRDELSNAVQRFESPFLIDRFTIQVIITMYNMMICVKNTASTFGTRLPKMYQLASEVLSISEEGIPQYVPLEISLSVICVLRWCVVKGPAPNNHMVD